MIRKLSTLIVFATLSNAAMASESADCYTTFYQTKTMECVDAFLGMVSKSAPNWRKQPHSMPSGPIGFLAELFSDYPQKREDILKKDTSDDVKSIYLMALFRAGLIDEAKGYAEKKSFTESFEKFKSFAIPTLKHVKPNADASENDLLIGAYMASGNTDYIEAILANYTGAPDAMVSDAFRVALMHDKFGPNLTPPGRENTMAHAACKKYDCKAHLNDFMHVMTLSSAFWAVQSLAHEDEGIKKTLLKFLGDNKHLKQLLADEQNAFGNYVTMLIAYAGVKDNANINSSLSIYENLGSAKDAFNAIDLKKNKKDKSQ